MAADYLRTLKDGAAVSDDEEIEQFLSMAKERGYSLKGEMFSAYHLAELASDCCGLHATVMEDVLNKESEHPLQLLGHLLKGSLLLVPYDSSKNFEPCCLGGRKAHWAIVKGFVVPNNDQQSEGDVLQVRMVNGEGEGLLDEVRYEDVLLVCQQPKSKRQALWTLEQLALSNANLMKADEELLSTPSQYVVPPTLDSTLKGKIILLQSRG